MYWDNRPIRPKPEPARPAENGMGTSLIRFVLLLAVAVYIAHYTAAVVTTVFFIATLIFYYRSKGEEPFWFAFFLVIQDGIFGYFINFENHVYVFPGLPAVEAGQLYIGVTILKASRVKEGGFRPFYFDYLLLLLIYLIFLVVQGYVWGVSTELNIQFRIIKFILPLFLLYSLPKLMDVEKQYADILYYLFPITFTILATQVFTILNGISPAQYLGINVETNHLFFVSKDVAYRGFFNDAVLLITLLGSFLMLSKQDNRFSNSYIYLVIISIFFSIFLSATRGWILGFFAVFFGFLFFVSKVKPIQSVKMVVISTIIVAGLYSFPIIKIQVDNAWERLMTLQALAKGDLTAGGTLLRLERRSPLVMKRWAESPLTGIGFSDDFFHYGDRHVANQNILLQTGIVGAALLLVFFLRFLWKLFVKSAGLPKQHPRKKEFKVFLFFFGGWFLIHSLTSQQFAFYAEPHVGMVIAYFFSLTALTYRNCGEEKQEFRSRTPRKLEYVKV